MRELSEIQATLRSWHAALYEMPEARPSGAMPLPSSTDDTRPENISGWHCEDHLDFEQEPRSSSISVSR
jgi:hypothetical protein